METARKRGHGVYFSEWQAAQSLDDLGREIVQWCRDTLARSRRPMGIDHFDLTLTVHADGKPRTHRLALLRPAELYDGGRVAGIVASILAPLSREDGCEPARIAAALLSWGDIAHATIS